MNRINEKVGAWLLEKGHTRTSLAASLGITTVTLDNKLTGETDWSWTQAKKLAGILDCSLDELAGFPKRTTKVVA